MGAVFLGAEPTIVRERPAPWAASSGSVSSRSAAPARQSDTRFACARMPRVGERHSRNLRQASTAQGVGRRRSPALSPEGWENAPMTVIYVATAVPPGTSRYGPGEPSDGKTPLDLA